MEKLEALNNVRARIGERHKAFGALIRARMNGDGMAERKAKVAHEKARQEADAAYEILYKVAPERCACGRFFLSVSDYEAGCCYECEDGLTAEVR